jgi:acyl carrier protein
VSDQIVCEVIVVLRDTLRLGQRAAVMTGSTRLLGALPEFDSMAVVSVVAALEERYGVTFEDDDLTGAAFESVDSLARLVDQKLG